MVFFGGGFFLVFVCLLVVGFVFFFLEEVKSEVAEPGRLHEVMTWVDLPVPISVTFFSLSPPSETILTKETIFQYAVCSSVTF